MSNQQEKMAKFLGFDFEVVYKVGVENKVDGALSQQHKDLEVKIMWFYPIWQQELIEYPFFKRIIEVLQTNPESKQRMF